jgi:hypothetical protein
MMTTLALGEEEGTPDDPDLYDPESWLKPVRPGKGDDDWATTMAVGEEGDPEPIDPGEVTTLALGEEGDCWVLEPEPIEMTTLALGEEGDEPYDIYM